MSYVVSYGVLSSCPRLGRVRTVVRTLETTAYLGLGRLGHLGRGTKGSCKVLPCFALADNPTLLIDVANSFSVYQFR